MPNYDYVCEGCGGFELRQRMSDDPLVRCPTCELPCRRKIGAGIGVIFKGSGFYETDYKRKSAAKVAKNEDGKG